MLSLRSFARFAPRAFSRIASSPLRQSVVTRPSSFVKISATSILQPDRAAFSTTIGRQATSREMDDELSAKLESEIQIEEHLKASEQQPSSVKDFLDNSPFELLDTPGQEVVKLVRTFGDEKITVSFSISDITNYDPYSEDSALEDDDLGDEASQQPNGQGNVSGGVRTPPAEESADEDVDEDMDSETPAPINLSIIIEKPGKTRGALNIDASAQDGNIVVENVFYYDDAEVAKANSPEAAQKRADVYPGPPFGSLDEDLQVLMERFLEERGITQAMAVFVPDYVDVKEQTEYLRWLANVKAFVNA